LLGRVNKMGVWRAQGMWERVRVRVMLEVRVWLLRVCVRMGVRRLNAER
jgi:hypothetical protein